MESKKFIYKNIDVLNNILQALEMGAFAGYEDKIKEALAEYTIIKQREAEGKNYDATDLMTLINHVLEGKESYEFDDKSKEIIINLIQALIKSYDKHIITDKIPKETYIREIIRVIEENIEVAEFVELEEDSEFGDMKDLIGESNREKLNRLSADGLTEKPDRKILIGSSDNKLGNTLHEIKHMGGNFREDSPSIYNIVISKVFEEGYATFNSELSGGPIMNDEAKIKDFSEGTKVTMGMPLRASRTYQQYKNIVDKLIYLIGMKKFEEIRDMEREFLENIKKELENKFGNDNAELFINALCQVSNIINPDGIKELDKLEEKKEKNKEIKRPDISEIEAVIEKINEITTKINSPEKFKIEFGKEKEQSLRSLDRIMQTLTGTYRYAFPENGIDKNEEGVEHINAMNEENVKEILERERAEEQKELFKLLDLYSKIFLIEKKHIQKPEISDFLYNSIEQQLKNDDKINPFKMIEEVTNNCFEIMIDNENTDRGLLELYKQIRIYNKNCRFGVIDNKTGLDITKKDFDKRIYSKLMEKMKDRNLIPEYLGDKQNNELIEEIVFNSSCYDLQDATIQLKEDNKGCAIEINGQGENFNAEVQNWEDKKYTIETNAQAGRRRIMEEIVGKKHKFTGCRKRKILNTIEDKGGKDHVYR